jgi:ATP-GRASP peptide maturase of grasp-with-spasm system
MTILFSSKHEGTTTIVQQWMESMDIPFIRINADDDTTKFKYYDITKNELIVNCCGKEVNLLKANSMWYRRKALSFKTVNISPQIMKKPVFPDSPMSHISHCERELEVLYDFIFTILQDNSRRVLGNYFTASINKLTANSTAEKYGFKVPESYILHLKNDLISLLKKRPNLITKAISDGIYLHTRNNGYFSYTEKITESDLKKIPERFFPSLFQVQIEKKYELRIFFIEDHFYPMAIFSQKDKQTVVDFRKYNNSKPNRTVPYSLSEDIRIRLTEMMRELRLNTGSIDIIIDKNNEYYFLEVNPVGQFGMTSQPCNYYLEKKIAEYFKK